MATDSAGVGGSRVRADVSVQRISVEPHRRVDRRLCAARAVRSRGRSVRTRRVDPVAGDADCVGDDGAAERRSTSARRCQRCHHHLRLVVHRLRCGEDVRASERTADDARGAAAAEYLAGDAVGQRQPRADLPAHDEHDRGGRIAWRSSGDLAGVDGAAVIRVDRFL